MRELLSVEEYLEELLALVAPDDRREEVGLEAALGRTLAASVSARVSIPAFANSAMDGYAVRYADVAAVPAELVVVGDVPAGSASDPAAASGECVSIMTGAPLPSFADTVVPVEDTAGWSSGATAAAGQGRVTVLATPARPGAHVRGPGEDVAAGTVVAMAGTTLTPGVIGALAAAGQVRAAVRPRPVVALAATGDELVADGSGLGRGQIYESNSLALAACLARDGADVRRSAPLPDRAEVLTAWLDAQAASGVDLIVLTGGASVGAYDVVRDVLAPHGEFRHVRLQPGKPQGWAVWSGVPVLSLPGNPLSAVLSYELFVRPLLDRRLGRPGPRWEQAVATTGWKSPAGRRQLVPVRLATGPDGRRLATPAHERGSASHLVTSLAGADGFAAVGEEVVEVAAGDVVAVRPL